MVAQRSGLKGHVDDQVVELWLREEDRVRRARCLACGRCALECDDAEVINSFPFNCGATMGSLPSVMESKTGSVRSTSP